MEVIFSVFDTGTLATELAPLCKITKLGIDTLNVDDQVLTRNFAGSTDLSPQRSTKTFYSSSQSHLKWLNWFNNQA